MRIIVLRVLEILATYPQREGLFGDYPDLREEDLRQALALAAGRLAVLRGDGPEPRTRRRGRACGSV